MNPGRPLRPCYAPQTSTRKLKCLYPFAPVSHIFSRNFPGQTNNFPKFFAKNKYFFIICHQNIFTKIVSFILHVEDKFCF